MEQSTDLAFATPSERRELLMDVLLARDEDAKEERIEGDAFGSKFASQGNKSKKGGVRRAAGTLSEFSGGQTMAYAEYNKSRNKEIKGTKGVKNAFMRKLANSTKKKPS
jgi:DNA excision repair protein ERCC-3